MKFIIVIRGVSETYYEQISKDIVSQCKDAGYDMPIFAYLPGDDPNIEIVWTDAEMELKNLQSITEAFTSKDG